MNNLRSDPDTLLSRIKEEESKNGKGRLKIFFGATAGVGKTYSMLEAAQKLAQQNIDIVVGYIETHGRKETEALLKGLEILPEKVFEYKGAQLRELDIDAALSRKPKIILVDELAHTNAPGSRHTKRWQDVQELLESGIDVFTTLNVQHVESLHDIVAQITRISIKERVPDSLLENASEIELIDLPPDELIERLKTGKVYMPDKAQSAMENFFRKGNLIALRELALRYTAERVVAEMDKYREAHSIKHAWPAAEHILVCISNSPLSARLVRAGKRMAEALRARWTVLYVENPNLLQSPEDKDRIIQTLRLAEQLGADTLELSGNNISEEIIKCASQYNLSKLIIGKPARPRWKEIIFGSVVDDVIRNSGPIDVYVITGNKDDDLPIIRSTFKSTSKTADYLKALLIVIACTCLAGLMLPHFEPSNVVMSYLLGIVIIAARYGRGPSILASILSVASFDFFFIPPYFTFAVSDTQYVVTFVVMLVVAFVISTLTVTIKQQAEAARLREVRTAALYSMSKDLASTLNIEDLVSLGLRHISSVFDSQVALFLPDHENKLILTAKGEGHYELTNIDEGIVAWVHQNKQSAGLSTATLPGAGKLYLPLLGAEYSIGVLVIKPRQEDRFESPEQLRLLDTFVNQLSLACERSHLSEENGRAQLLIKTEQLRSALLSSVSHDLRTPLATITGAASSILEGTNSLNLEICKPMIKEIYTESMRLNRLVSNLLDMTQLQSGTLRVSPEPQPVEEVIGAAVNYIEDKIKTHPIDTAVPSDLPFISVDAILIHQVLVNLIENATKYAPNGTDIQISAQAHDGMVTMAVADRGPGIKEELRGKIFEKFYREQPNVAGGAGLGLAICKGIIETHGGKIWVEDRSGGGSIFKFTVPIVSTPLESRLEKIMEESNNA